VCEIHEWAIGVINHAISQNSKPDWEGNYAERYMFPFDVEHVKVKREEFISIYSRLIGGRGAGADVLFRAELAAEGLRNNEIAEQLFVSENTVRAHLRSIYQKLDIDRRAKLAKKLR